MFFILAGTGELRLGDTRHPVRTGDIVACPSGGPDSAHQIINTGAVELRYLAVSTQLSPEICEYPDSGKYGATADTDAAIDGKPVMFRTLGRAGESLDYWDGE
jgi:uncharacterized cupin superfamily protein